MLPASKPNPRRHHRQPNRENHGKRGVRGYDAGRRINGRKRHVLVDTQGFLLAISVHAANIQDKPGGAQLLERFSKCFKRLSVIFADGGYLGQTMADAAKIIMQAAWRWSSVPNCTASKSYLNGGWSNERSPG